MSSREDEDTWDSDEPMLFKHQWPVHEWDDDDLDLSSANYEHFNYEPEDPSLYAIEQGMEIEPSESTSIYQPDIDEEPIWRPVRAKTSQQKQIHESFIYNRWARDEAKRRKAVNSTVVCYLPQKIVLEQTVRESIDWDM